MSGIAYVYDDDDGVQHVVYDDESITLQEIRLFGMVPFKPSPVDADSFGDELPMAMPCRRCGQPTEINGRCYTCRES